MYKVITIIILVGMLFVSPAGAAWANTDTSQVFDIEKFRFNEERSYRVYTYSHASAMAMATGAWSTPKMKYLKQPSEYGDNECELIAKDFQKEYGGSIIMIQPLKPNGAYDLGLYNAHYVNKLGNMYIDYKTGYLVDSIEYLVMWYEWTTGQKAKTFDLSIERPEFRFIWHY